MDPQPPGSADATSTTDATSASDATSATDASDASDASDALASADTPDRGSGTGGRIWWRRPVVVAGLVGGVAVVAVVLVWFQPQTLLFDTVVDEELPGVAAPPAAAAADPVEPPTDASDQPSEPTGRATEPGERPPDGAGQPADDGEQPLDPPDDDTAETDPAATGTEEAGTEETETEESGAADGATAAGDDEAAAAEAEPVALATGSFTSRNRYTVTGSATTYALPDGQRLVRLEGFRSTNGPDLFVYLTSAGEADTDADLDADAVDLGVLTGNVGDQNYTIPADVDLDRYDTVVIWCRRFSVSFGAADLA